MEALERQVKQSTDSFSATVAHLATSLQDFSETQTEILNDQKAFNRRMAEREEQRKKENSCGNLVRFLEEFMFFCDLDRVAVFVSLRLAQSFVDHPVVFAVFMAGVVIPLYPTPE